MIKATGWTLEEFDRQPFPFVLELIDLWYGDPKKRKKNVKGDYTNKKAASAAGILPDARNTAGNEMTLPPWVRDARQKLRDEAKKEK